MGFILAVVGILPFCQLGFCGLRWRKKVLLFLKDKEWREDFKVVVRVWIRI